MGCDIHIVLERRKRGSLEWIGVWASDEVPIKGRSKIAKRNYGLFSRFGVRGQREDYREVIYPRNIPEDVSRLAWTQYMRSPTDYHSASYATPEEFVAAWVKENPNDPDVRPEHALYDLLQLDTDYDGEHRLVFWFDN